MHSRTKICTLLSNSPQKVKCESLPGLPAENLTYFFWATFAAFRLVFFPEVVRVLQKSCRRAVGMQQGVERREKDRRGGLFCLIPAMARLRARRQDLKNQLPDIITLSEEPPLQESPSESPPLYSPPPPPPPPRFDCCESHIPLTDTQHLLLVQSILSLFHLCGCFIWFFFTKKRTKQDKRWDFSRTSDLFSPPGVTSTPRTGCCCGLCPPWLAEGGGVSAAQAPTWRLKPKRSEFGKSARTRNYLLRPVFFCVCLFVFIFVSYCKSRENTLKLLFSNSGSEDRRVSPADLLVRCGGL